MATAGLSLLGFMNQQEAIAHLLAHCVPEKREVPALVEQWQAARARKGPAYERRQSKYQRYARRK